MSTQYPNQRTRGHFAPPLYHELFSSETGPLPEDPQDVRRCDGEVRDGEGLSLKLAEQFVCGGHHDRLIILRILMPP